jgi:hypothetical protein
MTRKPRRERDTLIPVPEGKEGCALNGKSRGRSRRAFLRDAASAAGLVGLGLLAPGPGLATTADSFGAETAPGDLPGSAPGGKTPPDTSQPGSAEGQKVGRRQLVAYCGIYCGLCERRGRIPERAASLLEAMRKGEYQTKAETWETLEEIAHPAPDMCCRTGKCGDPSCAIRKCVQAKGLEVCPQCEQYPCERVRLFGTSEPLLLADGQRIRERGLDSWIEEQEKRRQDGFCYADIRCYPYHFPRE